MYVLERIGIAFPRIVGIISGTRTLIKQRLRHPSRLHALLPHVRPQNESALINRTLSVHTVRDAQVLIMNAGRPGIITANALVLALQSQDDAPLLVS